MRADAQRNRDRILGAARELVAETGTDATMEDIARRAGVAVGTLYRHFPAKEDLVSAVIDDSTVRIAALTEAALATVEAEGDPAAGPQFAALIRQVLDRLTTDRVFKAAAGRLDHHDLSGAVLAPGSSEARAVAAITALLDRARAAAAVRADVTLADLVMLVGAAPGSETPAPLRARYAEIVIAGLTGGTAP